jgi:hypothetical protein
VRIRLRSIIWPMILLAILIAGGALYPQLGLRLEADSNMQPVQHIEILKGTQPTYLFSAGIDGEIFPAFANYSSLQRPNDRQIGTFVVTVSNSTDATLKAKISVQVHGWSDKEIQNVEVDAGEVRKLLFAPTFLPRLYRNHEIAPATAELKITDPIGKPLFTDTVSVRLRSANDIYWGKDFKFAPFIASWVTPHDPHVEAVLARAKEFMPARRLPGYEEWKTADQQRAATYAQAKAIYRALQQSGVSYVKSSLTFGRNPNVSERVRLPGESIEHSSANCIDGVVMYASLFENLGMKPVVVLVPGHAYVGVRESENSDDYLYIETAITGRGASFENAVSAAQRGIARHDEKDVLRIRIAQARDAGIYPMPGPGHDSRHIISEEAESEVAASQVGH